jgi:uncharacterized protein (TIGR03437 family)
VKVSVLLWITTAQIPLLAQGPNTWTKGADMPTAVQGPATGVMGGLVYVVGGVSASATVNINQIYNPATDTWTTGAPMPTARYTPAGAVVNNIFYVIGGKLNGNQLNVVEAYDSSTDTWSSNYSPMPTARDSIQAAVYNGIIYVIGGFSNAGDRLKTVESYNPATDTWNEEASLKVGKSSVATAVLGSTIVAPGGLEDSGVTGDNEGYNPSTNSWSTLAPDATARQADCSGTIAGQLYVAGGKNNNAPVSVVESFNLTENQWTTLAPMPVATANSGQAVVGNLLYCFGGALTGTVVPNSTFSTNVLIYHPSGLPLPSISGVVSASAFGGFSDVAPGSWVEIYGSNLAPDTQGWTSANFTGNKAPTMLNDVSVSIGGQAAFIDYISPTQVNAQLPSNIAAGGTLQLTVTNANGTSAAANLNVNPTEPGLLAPAFFEIGAHQYVVAQHSDGSYVLPVGAILGVTSSPAKPGEIVVIYGVGFGAVTPNTPAGEIATGANQLSASFEMLFGQTRAQLPYFGLAPSFVGLYQFNVTVPAVANNDLLPLTFNLGGAAGSQTLYTDVNQ